MNIKEFKKLDLNKITLIDIREEEEFNYQAKIPQAIHIPKDELTIRLDEISKEEPVYLICHTWLRTMFMSEVLQILWYDAISVDWGMDAYLDNK